MENSNSIEIKMQSENINELITALSKAQGEISAASKDSDNPFFNSKYADLSSVWNACRDSLSRNGLAVIQTMNIIHEGQLFLVTTLAHSSGQWIRSQLPIKFNEDKFEKDKFGKDIKNNPLQKMGSCLTYLRRYALAAIVGVAPDDDDDGNSGGTSYRKQEKNKTISPEEIQFRTQDFLSQFPLQDPQMILGYFDKYCAHWKKSLIEAINDYPDREKFLSDFTKWEKKQSNTKGNNES